MNFGRISILRIMSFGVLALRFRDVLGDIALLLPSFWICVWVGVVLLFAMILYMRVVAWMSDL